MKKVTKISSLVLLSLLCLAGCSDTSSTSSDPSSSDDGSSVVSNDSSDTGNEQYTWTINVASPVEHQTFIQEQCEAFKEEYGYTNVTFNYLSYSESTVDTDVTDWSASGAPDVYAFASDKILSLAQLGALARVPTTIQNSLESEMSEEAIESGTLGDYMYGYPYAGDNGYFLYINTDFVSVEEAGSVEDIIAACAEAGLKFAYPLGEAFYSMAMLTTFGASYTVTLNDDYTEISNITATYDSEEGLQAAKGFRDLINNENVLVGDSSILAAPTEANGIGAIVGGSWNSADFEAAVGADKLVALKMPTITVDGETETLRSFLGYKLYGVNPLVSGDDTARLSFDHLLAQYLVSEEVQTARFEAFNIAPTNTAVSQLDEVTSNQYIKAINDQAAYAIPQTVVPQGLWNAPASLYAGIQDGSIVTDDDLATALVSLNDLVETAE